ncbi:hypothetical protein, partial [Escherichia coli]|uniref:hypothetical protein n=1 Tax=Escherichia coli TaxID=562 RepID=UPI001F1780D9
RVDISNNIFHTMTKAGIKGTYTSPSNVKLVKINNNIFYNNGTYGQDWNADPTRSGVVISDYNAYGTNSSGSRNNIAAGSHDVTITAD